MITSIDDTFPFSATIRGVGLAVNMNLPDQFLTVDKFGENPDIDTGTIPEDVWEIGGEYVYDADGTAPIVSLISDNPADTEEISVQGLDVNGNFTEQLVTLNGTSRVELTTPLWRVFRMYNNGSNSLVGTIYCYVGTGGIPIAADTRATIENGNNQTLMCLYTIPRGYVGFLFRGEIGCSRVQSTGSVQAAYYSRRYGKVFRIKKRIDITNQGSSYYFDKRSFPDIIPALTDVKITVESVSANNTGVFATLDILLIKESYFSNEYLQKIGQITERLL
jgi:hypothetical protein